MISNKTIALSEQRNVAMTNLTISLNRFHQTDRQKATISQQKATIDNLSQEIKRYQMREMGEQS